jgi:glycosyltransferase involved in cell wall biosynthesis
MPRLVVLISEVAGSGLDARARALFVRLPKQFNATLVNHRGGRFARIRHFLDALRVAHPDIIYIVDPIYAAIAATRLYRATHRARVVVDTGDLVYELAREMGKLGRAELAIVNWAEQSALHMADTIVVRGSFHCDLLIGRGFGSVQVIPDGVDLAQFFPLDVKDWRTRLGFQPQDVIIGTLGTINWNYRRQLCYGWEMIKVLSLLRDLPVRGLLVGDGDGIVRLQTRARELGITDRIVFAGRKVYSELPHHINAMDICLLTQPNSRINSVRTTGKLPLFLACDRFVLASQVGQAACVLPSEMLLPYDGIGRDEKYPQLLASRIRALVALSEQLRLNGRAVALAREHFDYNQLAQKLAGVLEQVISKDAL